ncbi:SLC41A family transporter [Thiomicrorhabdus indica]|uniref:SLC41A family transporter n=1 Tax=Thiomicrorhabdus indica TaxID=2267253 RepID=UPI00102DDE0D|nr:hypothetical protein [Thiomicrorhabdus indica]
MKKFDYLEAINYLMEMDTNILNPERYYPWYMHTKGILINGLSWLVLLAILAVIWLIVLEASALVLLAITFSCTILAGIVYALIFQNQIKEAKHKAIQQMMRLEKREFMRAIEPFVPDDQKSIVARIINHKDFKANEYASVTLATKSRIIFNTEAFIGDIERMMQKRPEILAEITDGYCDSSFKVPDSAIQNYQQKKINEQMGTFNDIFTVPNEVRQAVLMRIRQAALKLQPQNQ